MLLSLTRSSLIRKNSEPRQESVGMEIRLYEALILSIFITFYLVYLGNPRASGFFGASKNIFELVDTQMREECSVKKCPEKNGVRFSHIIYKPIYLYHHMSIHSYI